jgi:uncharacterized protein (DUF362 family)/NAD-dependent dihydropyrimidine dehydrogenase PreA subunit
MRVLLKPNLLKGVGWEHGITTHPAVIQAVAEAVREAGGRVWIGDSPGGPVDGNVQIVRRAGAIAAAEACGAEVVIFDTAAWKAHRGTDYMIASPVVEADLVIDLPKLKTHMLTLYTGAVKNLFGVIVGRRKREHHLQSPGVDEFSNILVDVLELVRPGLTIMDGILGIHGNGPGMSGVPHRYGCLAASCDPVALDAVLTDAMGYRGGSVIHLSRADERGLGVSDPNLARVVGDADALQFGTLKLPKAYWFLRAPPWVAAPVRRLARVRPRVEASSCIGCGRCVEVCPKDVITAGKPPTFELRDCIGCLCCAEICPRGAIHPRRSLVAQLIGLGY